MDAWAHVDATTVVIPGRAPWREPGIHNHRPLLHSDQRSRQTTRSRGYGFRAHRCAMPRNDDGGDLPDGSPRSAVRTPFASQNRLREKTHFVRLLNMFALFKPLRENNSLFRKHKSGVSSARPASARGAFRPIVTKREAGCDGRDARNDEARIADGEIVRSRSPDAGIKPEEMIFRRRRLESPALRGDHV
jgi:hypothetical protein